MTTPPTPATVAGRALSDWSRDGRFGTWHALVPNGDGEPPHGALRIDRALLAPQGARQRLAAAVRAVAKLRLPGVPATVDLVAEAGDVWLLVTRPPVRTVADLLAEGAPGLDEGSAASVLNETAQTLLALHAAGLAHGALAPDRVVLAPDGTALLAEAALATALAADVPAATARQDDVTAWAALARTLATAWATPGTPAAELFARCADAADSGDLTTARTTLTTGRAALPQDFLRRTALRTAAAAALAELTRGGQAADAPAQEGAGDDEAPDGAAPEGATPEGPAADTEETVLGRRGQVRGPAAVPGDQATVLSKRNQSPTAAPVEVADGGHGGESEDGEILLRFGPGVPLTEEDALRALWAAPKAGPVRKRRRRAGLLGTVAVLAAVAVALWLLLRPTAGPTVTAAEVTAPTQELSCGQTAEVTGVVHTDGRGGPITYRWLRSDGRQSEELTRTARRGEHEVTVHLQWTVRGPGLFRGTARLQVLRPAGSPVEAEGSFRYSCA
ncbi:hypothetical protein ACFY8W_26370 [Streptomyces sp. NPDC012637]|uniref:hypothetical protein n=1 Tax=Streptomyces sp. NPDC012637 TaxID=3364842 RepID=UPI0036E1F10C